MKHYLMSIVGCLCAACSSPHDEPHPLVIQTLKDGSCELRVATQSTPPTIKIAHAKTCEIQATLSPITVTLDTEHCGHVLCMARTPTAGLTAGMYLCQPPPQPDPACEIHEPAWSSGDWVLKHQ